MTDVTCHATRCKYNSAKAWNSCNGSCMLEHIKLVVNDDDSFSCTCFEYDHEKPVKEGDAF